MPTTEPISKGGRKPLPKSRRRINLNISLAPETRRRIVAAAREKKIVVGRYLDQLFSGSESPYL
jgi:hypothetical protein